jgi:hypothetical protein
MVPGMTERERLATAAYRRDWLAGTDVAPAPRPATLRRHCHTGRHSSFILFLKEALHQHGVGLPIRLLGEAVVQRLDRARCAMGLLLLPRQPRARQSCSA